jgi:hypothetical protein
MAVSPNNPAAGLLETTSISRLSVASIDALPRSAFTISDIVKMSGMSRASIFRVLKAGRLKAHKFGSRTLIFPEHRQEFRNSLPRRAA